MAEIIENMTVCVFGMLSLLLLFLTYFLALIGGAVFGIGYLIVTGVLRVRIWLQTLRK